MLFRRYRQNACAKRRNSMDSSPMDQPCRWHACPPPTDLLRRRRDGRGFAYEPAAATANAKMPLGLQSQAASFCMASSMRTAPPPKTMAPAHTLAGRARARASWAHVRSGLTSTRLRLAGRTSEPASEHVPELTGCPHQTRWASALALASWEHTSVPAGRVCTLAC